MPRSLNPLHCGAVVASPRLHVREATVRLSLNPLHCGAVVASRRGGKEDHMELFLSQSPSLRGSGRFSERSSTRFERPSRLNPLHCGAVVASPERAQRLKNQLEVSIPFIAGQWSLRALPALAPERAQRVSIPFIAGQWSLPAYYAGRTQEEVVS